MASSLICRPAGILISKITGVANRCKLGVGPRMMSSMSSDESSPTPWLMLPSSDSTAYKFYSLYEKKIVSIEKNRGEESPEDDAEVVGSSHGWLAMLNRRNNDLFLSNPRSGQHIKLPTIERNGRASVTKVILSSSPNEKGCRAVMTYGVGNRLVYCSPGRSWRWSDMSGMWPVEKNADMVYCKRRRVLICVTQCDFDLVSFYSRTSIDEWDIEHPFMDELNMGDPQLEDFELRAGLPSVEGRFINVESVLLDRKREDLSCCSWVEENMKLLQEQCIQIPHLVYAEQMNRLYVVLRFVHMAFPVGVCKTVGFLVLEVGRHGYFEVVHDLNGLAMFVGINHSSAIPASQFPHLKPNSIYFTAPTGNKMLHHLRNYTGVAVFDYQNKTMSPIIQQGGQSIESSLTWFTPTPT